MITDKLIGTKKTSAAPPAVGTLVWSKLSPYANMNGGPFTFASSWGFGKVLCHNSTHVFVGSPNCGASPPTSGDLVGTILEGHATDIQPGIISALNISTGALDYTIYGPIANLSSQSFFGFFNPSSAGDYDSVGSVACTDSYLVVGTVKYTQSSQTYSGIVHVYNATTGILVWTLLNPNPAGTYTNDYFGCSVAINSTYVIVGAYLEDYQKVGSTEYTNKTDSGTVYVFNLSNGTLARKFSNPSSWSTPNLDWFGWKIACNSTLVAIGAPGEDYNVSYSGIVYIFSLITGDFLQIIRNPLDTTSTLMGTYFGSVMSMSESYLLVGCQNVNTATTLKMGAAYLFDPVNNVLLMTWNDPDKNASKSSDKFGSAVAVNEQYSVIANILDRDPAIDDPNFSGTNNYYPVYVYVYSNTTGALVKRIKDPNLYNWNDYSQFGFAISINSTKLCITNPGSDYITTPSIGDDEIHTVGSVHTYAL